MDEIDRIGRLQARQVIEDAGGAAPKELEETFEEKAAREEAEREKEAEDRALVERAMECYRVGIDTSSAWRHEAIQDLEFVAGEQWDSNVKAARAIDGRPMLTVSRLPQLVRQVTNEQRQAKSAITVNPVDDGSDKTTAEVYQGVIRNVEYTSNADVAYATAGESAARTGLGYIDVRAEYESERSFEQRLTIGIIEDPLSVVMDPSAKEVAGDDARWAIISTDSTKAEFKAKYPKLEVPVSGDWGALGDKSADWVAKEGVRIHEYRYIEEESDTLFDLSEASPELMAAMQASKIDTSTGAILASEIGPDFVKNLEQAGFESRETTRRKAFYAKIAGDQVLEQGELAGKYIQLVRVVGTKIKINGSVNYEGVIRQAKDPQRILNYAASAEIEAIALTPKAPWLVAEGQIEGYETQWKESNQKPLAVLQYKPKAFGASGQLLPPPQRIQAEANIGAITQARQQAGQDLYDVTGIYPTQFGGPAPEQSGVAIQRRVNQGQISNFHYTDNLAQAIRYTGRILIDLIPRIYSGPRVMRILGEEDKHEMVPVNQPGTFRGKQVNIQLDQGRYDLAVSMGPGYLSRRQEATAQLGELMHVAPQMAPVIGDLYVRNLDVPGADQIADRLEKLLPPEIRPPNADKQPPPQVLMQQVQQLSAQNQQLAQQLHRLAEIIETKALENKSKEKIALINAEVDLVKTRAQLDHENGQAMLERTHDIVQTLLEAELAPDPEHDPVTQPQPSPQGAPPNGPAGPAASPNGA